VIAVLQLEETELAAEEGEKAVVMALKHDYAGVGS
jgi:hypothetical protein